MSRHKLNTDALVKQETKSSPLAEAALNHLVLLQYFQRHYKNYIITKKGKKWEGRKCSVSLRRKRRFITCALLLSSLSIPLCTGVQASGITQSFAKMLLLSKQVKCICITLSEIGFCLCYVAAGCKFFSYMLSLTQSHIQTVNLK